MNCEDVMFPEGLAVNREKVLRLLLAFLRDMELGNVS